MYKGKEANQQNNKVLERAFLVFRSSYHNKDMSFWTFVLINFETYLQVLRALDFLGQLVNNNYPLLQGAANLTNKPGEVLRISRKLIYHLCTVLKSYRIVMRTSMALKHSG